MSNVNPLSVCNSSPVYEVITQSDGTKLMISDFVITQRNYVPLIGYTSFLFFEQTINANGWIVTNFGENTVGLSATVLSIENQNNYGTETVEILISPESAHKISDSIGNVEVQLFEINLPVLGFTNTQIGNNDQFELITEIQSILNQNEYGSPNAELFVVSPETQNVNYYGRTTVISFGYIIDVYSCQNFNQIGNPSITTATLIHKAGVQNVSVKKAEWETKVIVHKNK